MAAYCVTHDPLTWFVVRARRVLLSACAVALVSCGGGQGEPATLPKGIDISSYSQAKLNAVARQLNERPRKTLGFQTPAERFSQTVASTG